MTKTDALTGDVTSPGEAEIERRKIPKVSWPLMPFLILCYLIAYIDPTNIGFAALTMNADLGLSSAAFGLGGSLFFVAYVLFEVPSNLAQLRYGARRWIARIMIRRAGSHQRSANGLRADWRASRKQAQTSMDRSCTC